LTGQPVRGFESHPLRHYGQGQALTVVQGLV
jgi:hypothetical protein